MKVSAEFIRPAGFDLGATYWLKRYLCRGREFTWVRVRFVQYHACPAFVILENEAGCRQRCARDDVFEKTI